MGSPSSASTNYWWEKGQLAKPACFPIGRRGEAESLFCEKPIDFKYVLHVQWSDSITRTPVEAGVAEDVRTVANSWQEGKGGKRGRR